MAKEEKANHLMSLSALPPIAPFDPRLVIRRYKRFLVDVTLDTGETITAHRPNSGSMKSLITAGNAAYHLHDFIPVTKGATGRTEPLP